MSVAVGVSVLVVSLTLSSFSFDPSVFSSLDEGTAIVFYVHELLYGYDSALTFVATYASD